MILSEELDKQLEEKLERKLEEKLECKLEEKLDQKLEEKLDQKLEEKLEQKLEEKLDQKLEEKLELKLEEKMDQKLAPIYEELKKIDRLDGRVANLEEGQERLSSKITSLEEGQERLGLLVSKNGRRIEDVDIHVSSLELDVKRSERAIRADISRLKDANDTLITVLESKGILPLMQ